jgi:chemotaxis protein histidine kinase CheA
VGKPEEGLVHLSALHRSGRIVIEVADDGAGIDRARVKSIAAAKGLIAAEAQLSDEEIDNLIFLPGFTTASAVSDISGRGVGMDVVRRSNARRPHFDSLKAPAGLDFHHEPAADPCRARRNGGDRRE